MLSLSAGIVAWCLNCFLWQHNYIQVEINVKFKQSIFQVSFKWLIGVIATFAATVDWITIQENVFKQGKKRSVNFNSFTQYFHVAKKSIDFQCCSQNKTSLTTLATIIRARWLLPGRFTFLHHLKGGAVLSAETEPRKLIDRTQSLHSVSSPKPVSNPYEQLFGRRGFDIEQNTSLLPPKFPFVNSLSSLAVCTVGAVSTFGCSSPHWESCGNNPSIMEIFWIGNLAHIRFYSFF